MITVSGASSALELKLAGAVTTNQLPVAGSYATLGDGIFSVTEINSVSNSTTIVTLVSGPAAGANQLKFLSVRNADTAAATVVLQHYNGTNRREIVRFTLAVDDVLIYEDANGFRVFDSAGKLKTATSGSSPLTTKGDIYGYSSADARLPVGSNGQVLTADSAQTLGIKWAAASGGTNALLDGSAHTDTTAGSVARGDLITGQGASPTWTRLAKGGTTQLLMSDGTDIAWVTPAGGALTITSNSIVLTTGSVTYDKIQDISATSRILGRKTSGAGDTEECTLSEVLDFVGSAAQGDILYRNGTTWVRLGAGTSGHFLKTQGAGANPTWASAGSPTEASQAEMETPTGSTQLVTPRRVRSHPGVAKVWVDFNGTGTIANNISHGVSSLTDNGTGDYTVTFSESFSSANYTCAGMVQYASDGSGSAGRIAVEIARSSSNPAVGSVRIRTFDTSPGTLFDCLHVSLACFGDI